MYKRQVDDQRRVVLVEDADAADVQGLGDVGGVVVPHGAFGRFHGGVGAVGPLLAVLAEEQVDTAEEEVLELVVEAVQVDAGPEDLRVALGQRARGADLAALGRVVHQELGFVDLLFQPPVHPVQVFLFDADLPVTHGIMSVVHRADRGLLNLSGHRAPF